MTPEDVARLYLKAKQGDIVPLLHRVGDMADLVERQEKVIEAADALAAVAAEVREKNDDR